MIIQDVQMSNLLRGGRWIRGVITTYLSLDLPTYLRYLVLVESSSQGVSRRAACRRLLERSKKRVSAPHSHHSSETGER